MILDEHKKHQECAGNDSITTPTQPGHGDLGGGIRGQFLHFRSGKGVLAHRWIPASTELCSGIEAIAEFSSEALQ